MKKSNVSFTYVYVIDGVQYHVPQCDSDEFDKATNNVSRLLLAVKVIDANGKVVKDVDNSVQTG